MDDRTYRNIMATIAEARAATNAMRKRLGVPPMTDEESQAAIDAEQAAMLRHGTYASVDAITEESLKGGKR